MFSVTIDEKKLSTLPYVEYYDDFEICITNDVIEVAAKDRDKYVLNRNERFHYLPNITTIREIINHEIKFYPGDLIVECYDDEINIKLDKYIE